MLLEEMLGDVMAFHMKVTGMPMPETPTFLQGERYAKAMEFLSEELTEFEDSSTVADQADALVDLIYVAMGKLLEMGIRPGPAFKLVHAANMAKVGGTNKRGSQYEAAKPEGWKPPDWDTFLRHKASEPTVEDKGQYIGLTREPAPKPKPKILLLGYGRHGKDTVAEMLRDKYDFRFTSSSLACAEKIMYPFFQQQYQEWDAAMAKGTSTEQYAPPFYLNVGQCFEDRHNHRATWFKKIEDFNTPDKASLGKMIFSGYDIYCGMRSAREFAAVKNSGLYDVCVWVDRSQHVPAESRDSCTVEPWMADYILDNNGSLTELEFNLHQLMENILA